MPSEGFLCSTYPPPLSPLGCGSFSCRPCSQSFEPEKDWPQEDPGLTCRAVWGEQEWPGRRAGLLMVPTMVSLRGCLGRGGCRQSHWGSKFRTHPGKSAPPPPSCFQPPSTLQVPAWLTSLQGGSGPQSLLLAAFQSGP